jgi:hypothetical protein
LPIEDTFRSRLEEVQVLLRSAASLEAQQAYLPVPSHDVERMLSSAKAAAHIMIYNAVEFVLTAFVEAVRNDIEVAEVKIDVLSLYWKRDFLKYLFAERLASGIHHGTLIDMIAESAFSVCRWREETHKRKLPLGGNVNKRRIFELLKALDVNFKPPAGTLGGDDLENIWTRRNALAHGEESFEEAGRQMDAETTLEIVARVQTFITALMETLETYRKERRFIEATLPT